MNRYVLLIIGLLIILGVVIAVARMSTAEDSWVCQGDRWVMHGHPSAPMPTSACSEEASEQ